MSLRARSCPTCHSIGPPKLSCIDTWHDPVLGSWLESIEAGTLSGHRLAREVIARHGRDRFPTVQLNLLQLVSEVGELCGEYAKAKDRENSSGNTTDSKRTLAMRDPLVLKELGDAGLSLFEVANKLGVNLIEIMARTAAGEERKP